MAKKAKEEQLALRKGASKVAREVRGFWAKLNKVRGALYLYTYTQLVVIVRSSALEEHKKLHYTSCTVPHHALYTVQCALQNYSGRDGRTCLAIPNFQGANGGRKKKRFFLFSRPRAGLATISINA